MITRQRPPVPKYARAKLRPTDPLAKIISDRSVAELQRRGAMAILRLITKMQGK